MILKVFAGRDLDWMDVEGVLVRQRGRLDWRYLLSQLRPRAQLKEAPEIIDRLNRSRRRAR